MASVVSLHDFYVGLLLIYFINHQSNAQQSINSNSLQTQILISASSECRNDVNNFCSQSIARNNFDVLDCLQSDKKVANSGVSTTCQNYLWHYKKNLTTDEFFMKVARTSCNNLGICSDYQRSSGKGLLVSCLVENRRNISDGACRQFLTKISTVVFSDYQLISRFADACRNDISQHQCGRIGQGPKELHSQGETIDCLSLQFSKLSDGCRLQILRVAELQADDFHLDRPLYYACRDDRERFCSKTKAGGGKVFKCLYRHKFDRDLSSECQKQLLRRQKLMQYNYKANKPFTEHCKEHIKHYSCLRYYGNMPSKASRMSYVIECLSAARRNGSYISPECIAEVNDMRRTLLNDYRLSPGIVVDCESEIQDYCGKGVHREGKTLHCLMDVARRRRPSGKIISSKCKMRLKNLLHVTNVAEDYRMDPSLQKACAPVVQVLCNDIKPGEERMYDCLLTALKSPKMSPKCEEKLMEVQYFITRDFRFDSRLYRACKIDAEKSCSAQSGWKRFSNSSHSRHVFSCLYRQYKLSGERDMQLSRGCSFEVRRTLRQRAISVEMNPLIQEPCLNDLGKFCGKQNEFAKGEEMRCLTKNFKLLDQECRMAVSNYTEDVNADPEMDRKLFMSCRPLIREYCRDHTGTNFSPGTLMQCLISNKHQREANSKCFVSIEHYQLINLNNYRFSVKFRESCEKAIERFCEKNTEKAQIVRCLADQLKKDILAEQTPQINQKCRRQLRMQLLQRSENIMFNPLLKEKCSYDIKMFCSNVENGQSMVIECLKSSIKKITAECALVLYKQEKISALMQTSDYALMSVCKRMIKMHCETSKLDEIVTCLTEHNRDHNFDMTCLKMLNKRLISRASDIKLNPKLEAACSADVSKWCTDEVVQGKGNYLSSGRVLDCLKKQYMRTSPPKLASTCSHYVGALIRRAQLDYRRDPVLYEACKSSVHQLCFNELELSNNDFDPGTPNRAGMVMECLKAALTSNKLTDPSCRKAVSNSALEEAADIQVDPLLYRACVLDIKHYCFDVPHGSGRQMSCLLSGLNDNRVRLTTPCSQMLRNRQTLWEYAAKVEPPKNFNELSSHIYYSPARNYFVIIILSSIAVIFCGGMCFGRLTRKARAVLKNR